jgi:hypothetical protein
MRWEDEEQSAIDKIRQALTKPPILALPNLKDNFILDNDASDNAIGAEWI